MAWVGDRDPAGIVPVALSDTRDPPGANRADVRSRMAPIGEIFAGVGRAVPELLRAQRKDIRLEIAGGETEIDASLVGGLGEVLMHLVRNAVDHGIEGGDRRVAAGKDPVGTVTLTAYRTAGNIVVAVGDDGAGLHTEEIRRQAIRRGLWAPDDACSDEVVGELIFEPGVSTAEASSGEFARGAGLDQVRRRVAALGGVIGVRSRAGDGVRFTIRLPRGVIDGVLARVGAAGYVFPLDAVAACAGFVASAATQGEMLLHGEAIPTVDLRSLFALGGRAPNRCGVVVVSDAGRKVGVVVDRVFGEIRCPVAKVAGQPGNRPGIGGIMMMASGESASIVDVPALVEAALGARKPVRISTRADAAARTAIER